MTTTKLLVYFAIVAVSLATCSPWKAEHSVARLICRQFTSGAANCTATVFHESWALTTKTCVANCADMSLLMKINDKNTLIPVTNVHKHPKIDDNGKVNFNLALLELGYSDVIRDVKGDFPELLTNDEELRGRTCSTGCLRASWYPCRQVKNYKNNRKTITTYKKCKSGAKRFSNTDLGKQLTEILTKMSIGTQDSSALLITWLETSAKMTDAFLQAALSAVYTGENEVKDIINMPFDAAIPAQRQLCFPHPKPCVCMNDVGKPIICDGKLAGIVIRQNDANEHFDDFLRLNHPDYVDWISNVTRLF